jgi:hypothetical protein
MLPDLIDIGLQSIGKPIGARFEPLGLIEENEIIGARFIHHWQSWGIFVRDTASALAAAPFRSSILGPWPPL